MNFLKGSKRQLTHTPHPSEWSLSLEIMCMHFILSGPCTSLHIFDLIHYKKNCNIIFRKWGGGGVEGRLEFFRKFIRFGRTIHKTSNVLISMFEEKNWPWCFLTMFEKERSHQRCIHRCQFPTPFWHCIELIKNTSTDISIIAWKNNKRQEILNLHLSFPLQRFFSEISVNWRSLSIFNGVRSFIKCINKSIEKHQHVLDPAYRIPRHCFERKNPVLPKKLREG